MRARFFGPEASTAHADRAAGRALPGAFARSTSTSATPRAIDAVFAEHAPALELVVHTAAQPSHDWAAPDPQTDFARQRQRHAEPARGDAAARARRDFIFMLDEQGLRRPAELPAARRARERGSSCPRTTSTTTGSPTSMSIDRSLHSLFGVSKAAADLLVQEYGRYFEHADRLLPRRLPDRAQPRRRAAARLPLVPDALHRHRRAVHGLRLRRQAGARQHPQRRPRPRVRGLPRARRGRPPSTTSAAAASRNCSMLEAIALCERDRRPRARLDARRRARGSATTAGGSATSASSGATTRTGGSSTASRRSCARSTSRTSRRWSGRRVKLSVVIPAHNEARLDRGDARRRSPQALERERSRLRDPRRRRREHRRHRGASSSSSATANPRIRCIRSHYPRGFGFAVRAGLERFEGDAVAIVMADGSDDPADLVALLPPARGGLRLRLRLALRAAARTVHDYPRLKLVLNRMANLVHPGALPPRLQRHDERVQGLPARGDRDRPAAALEPLQPHGRAAAEGDRARPQLRGRARSRGRTARPGRRS